MSHVELVQVRTADGVRLDGALAVPKHGNAEHQPQVDALLAVHGTGSSFYATSLFEGLTPKLLADGINVLRVNTRGHDVISNAATLHGPLRLGSALERVDECRHDLVAWIEFLVSRGCRSIALAGHSLGAIKAVYTCANAPHAAVTRLIAISPPRLSHAHFLESSRCDEFLAHFRQAQAHASAGHGDALMEITTPLPFIVSAASFIDKYGPDEKYNILRQLQRLQLPSLFVFGEIELQEVNFCDLPEAVAESAVPTQKIRVVTVSGANHSYTGTIDELSHKIRAWLAAAD